MNRRQFLKVSGVAYGMLALWLSPRVVQQIASRPQAEANGKLYRGTVDGRIYTSEDRGRSWKLHTNLGDQCSVLGFSEGQRSQVTAHVSHQLRDFDLTLSQDERFWMAA